MLAEVATSVTARIVVKNLGMRADATTGASMDSVSGRITLKGLSAQRVTIIGSDGVLIRQDAENLFLVDRYNDKIRVQLLGYQKNVSGLRGGQLWVNPNNQNALTVFEE